MLSPTKAFPATKKHVHSAESTPAFHIVLLFEPNLCAMSDQILLTRVFFAFGLFVCARSFVTKQLQSTNAHRERQVQHVRQKHCATTANRKGGSGE
jgi:hypothetical protein